MKTQKDFFNNDKEERIVDLKRQIYEELLKPYRKACLKFVNMRHDSSFRSEEEDLQDLLDITRSNYANSDYSNYEDSLFRILKDAFISRWNIRKYNGGWK